MQPRKMICLLKRVKKWNSTCVLLFARALSQWSLEQEMHSILKYLDPQFRSQVIERKRQLKAA